MSNQELSEKEIKFYFYTGYLTHYIEGNKDNTEILDISGVIGFELNVMPTQVFSSIREVSAPEDSNLENYVLMLNDLKRIS